MGIQKSGLATAFLLLESRFRYKTDNRDSAIAISFAKPFNRTYLYSRIFKDMNKKVLDRFVYCMNRMLEMHMLLISS